MAKATPKKHNNKGQEERGVVGRTDLYKVPFSKMLVRPGFNRRYDYGNIRELADSILAHNEVLEPMVGFKEKGKDIYYISEGHRRFAALKMIKETTGKDMHAPFRLEARDMTDDRRLTAMFGRNTEDGKPFTVLEQAEVVKALKNDYSKIYPDNTSIAAKLGKTSVYIGKLLTLANGPEPILKLVRAGQITGTYAMELIQTSAVDEFIEKVKMGEFDRKKEQGEIFSGDDGPTPSQVISAPAISLEQAASNAARPRGKQAPITKKAVKKNAEKGDQAGQAVNSWTELKKFLKSYEGTPPDPAKASTIAFLGRVNSNEYTAEQLTRYFNQPKKR